MVRAFVFGGGDGSVIGVAAGLVEGTVMMVGVSKGMRAGVGWVRFKGNTEVGELFVL